MQKEKYNFWKWFLGVYIYTPKYPITIYNVQNKLKWYQSESMLTWLHFVNSIIAVWWYNSSSFSFCSFLLFYASQSISFFFFFSLSLWIWHCLFFIVHFFLFLVDSFDGFRPLLVASQCQIGSLPNKLSLFVRSLRPCHFHRARPHNIVSSWERTSLVARPHEEVSRWDRKTLVEQHCQRWANWGRRRPFAARHSHTQRQLAVLSG